MWKKFIQLLLAFFCGYLFIKWFPVVFPFQLSELILVLVLKPFEFFAASILFIVGFMTYALLIKDGAEQLVKLYYRKKINVVDFFHSLFVIISFIFLFQAGFWQTTVFFFFSVLYGMISLDFRSFKLVD